MICNTYRWYNPQGFLLCDSCGFPIWYHDFEMVLGQLKILDPTFLEMLKGKWDREYFSS